jgi:hypothetical protein
MGSLVLGGFETVGSDDLDGDDDMSGDLVVGRGRRRGRLHRKHAVVQTPSWMNATTSQGVSRPQEDLDFVPFVPASIAIGALSGSLTSLPQRPVRPERLVMDAASAGASAVSNVVITPAIFVGAVQVGAVQGSTPISSFGATAFGVRLSMPPCGQGTLITIGVGLLTAAAAITVVTATMFGAAMR